MTNPRERQFRDTLIKKMEVSFERIVSGISRDKARIRKGNITPIVRRELDKRIKVLAKKARHYEETLIWLEKKPTISKRSTR